MVAVSYFCRKGFGLLVFAGGFGPVGNVVVEAAWYDFASYDLKIFQFLLRYGADSGITTLILGNRFYTLNSLS